MIPTRRCSVTIGRAGQRGCFMGTLGLAQIVSRNVSRGNLGPCPRLWFESMFLLCHVFFRMYMILFAIRDGFVVMNANI